MNGFIDLYCERTGSGLWAEPLNALSNLAFFFSSWFAWRLYYRSGNDRSLLILTLFIFMIAMGSTLFHVFATRWAMLADTIPILMYQLAFCFCYSRFVIGLRPFVALAPAAGFMSLSYLAAGIPDTVLNGSASYLPALAFLCGFGIYHAAAAKPGRYMLLAASLLFAVSLTARSLDMALCAAWPSGLHYFWHVLNAGVLYLTVRAYAESCKTQTNF
jgi:hypothetical protein